MYSALDVFVSDQFFDKYEKSGEVCLLKIVTMTLYVMTLYVYNTYVLTSNKNLFGNIDV